MKRLVISVGVAVGVALAGWQVAGAQEAPRGPGRPPRDRFEKPKLKVKLNEKLKFMQGCWRGPIDEETEVEEIWNAPSENLMTATTRYLRKGWATSYEFSRIVSTDSTVTFSASSEGRPFDEYTMTQLVDDYVVFDNPKKTFPNRISYRMVSDGSLIPRNEGEGQPSIEVRFKRVKCPGDK